MNATLKQARAELEDYRAELRRREDSRYERNVDDDCWVSQWAENIILQEKEARVMLAEADGLVECDVLCNIETGEPIHARIVETRYGHSWMVADAADNAVDWLPDWAADDTKRRKSNAAARGYVVRRALKKGEVAVVGNGTGLSGSARVVIRPVYDARWADAGIVAWAEETDEGDQK